MKKHALAIAALVLLSSPAMAQTAVIFSGTIAANSGGTAVPATTGYPRNYATVCNYSTVSSLFCRSDGGTPANLVGIGLAPWASTNTQPCHTWEGTMVGVGAITCQCDGLSTCPISGEYIQ